MIEEKPKPKVQKLCVNCNHSKTFHGSGRTRCNALGCACNKWRPPLPPLTVADVAKRLGKGQTWIKDHALALGGEKINNRWYFEESVRLSEVPSREGD